MVTTLKGLPATSDAPMVSVLNASFGDDQGRKLMMQPYANIDDLFYQGWLDRNGTEALPTGQEGLDIADAWCAPRATYLGQAIPSDCGRLVPLDGHGWIPSLFSEILLPADATWQPMQCSTTEVALNGGESSSQDVRTPPQFQQVCRQISPSQRLGRAVAAQQPRALNLIPPARSRGLRKCRRIITSETALRIFYIPQTMHKQLDLYKMFPKCTAVRRANECTVTLITASCIACTVTMTKVTSNGHPHRRFSTGWREFCKLAGLSVGDELMFMRGRRPNELAVRVSKKGTRNVNDD